MIQSEHEKVKNLLSVLARNQSNYKKLFLKLEGKSVDEIVERLRYDLVKSNELIDHYKDLNVSL